MANEIIQFKESDYSELLQQAVAVIENARTSIARHIASAASNTYWEIGKLLHEKKLESKHGSGVVKRLSVDLKERYPDMGMSPRNLWYMKTFYERYNSCDTKVQRAVALFRFLNWNWKTGSLRRLSYSCWNWAKVSPSLATSIPSNTMARRVASICFSSTGGCVASWQLI